MLSGLLLVLLPGCNTPPGVYKTPDVSLPSQYLNDQGTSAADPGLESAPTEAVPEESLIEWWHYFGNSELERLIDRGLSNNPDIRIALNRIVQAKARADQTGAGKYPSVSAPLILAQQYPGGTTVGTAPTSGSSGSSQTVLQASVRADWRLDIWGEQQALSESANFQLRRAVHERENVQRNLAASLASHYVEYLSINDRLRIALETDDLLNATLSTIEKRVATGDATLSELEQQRAMIYSVRATIPTLEQQRHDAIGAMAVLVGTVPGNLNLSDQGLDTLAIPGALPGLPSALLLRRPDIRMAEAQLHVANADVSVARARLLPPMDLSAQAGYSSTSLSQLFLPRALFWNVVDSVTVSIFDSGRKKNEQIYSQAVQEEMVESYMRTIHQAMKEVESALASVRLAEKRLTAQKETIQSSRRAWDISTKVYTLGGIDYLTLLDTQRSYHRYLDEYQKTRQEYLRGYIGLFQALGGGVKPPQPATQDGEDAPLPDRTEARPIQSVEGIPMNEGAATSPESFWQVELGGLYHRATIGPAWRDLITRYPQFMEGRIVRPRLNGRIDENIDGAQSWHRLYVAKFDSPGLAEEFCAALKADQQRCRVVSSQSDDTVVVSPPSRAATPVVDRKAPEAPTPQPAPPALAAKEPPPVPAAAPAPSTSASTSEQRIPIKITPKATDGPRDRMAYAVQLGAFSSRENAALAQVFWKQKGYDIYVNESRAADNRPLFAVRSGVYALKKDAIAAAQAIRSKEDGPAVSVPILVDLNGMPSKLDLGAPGTLEAQAPPAVEPPETNTFTPLVSAPIGPQITGPGAAAPKNLVYALQLGAFSSAENAIVSANFWRGKGYDTRQVEIQDAEGRHWYAVRTGNYPVKNEAATAAVAFGRKENTLALVTPTWAEQQAPATTMTPTPATTSALAGEAPKMAWTVQLGAYASRNNASLTASVLQARGVPAYVEQIRDHRNKTLHAVRAGSFKSRAEAQAMIRTLNREERKAALLVEVRNDLAGLAARQVLIPGKK